MPNCAPHPPVSRANAYAAGTANSRVIKTTTAPANTVFPTQRRKSVSVKRSLRCSSVGRSLKMNGLLSRLYRSEVRLNVVINIQ